MSREGWVTASSNTPRARAISPQFISICYAYITVVLVLMLVLAVDKNCTESGCYYSSLHFNSRLPYISSFPLLPFSILLFHTSILSYYPSSPLSLPLPPLPPSSFSPLPLPFSHSPPPLCSPSPPPLYSPSCASALHAPTLYGMCSRYFLGNKVEQTKRGSEMTCHVMSCHVISIQQ